mmetsp:Transcript_13343/g.39302  ORF Transcript_13343/g.39302 Transcript_13343/m.39302 type:complete len:453 (-) Transcript_13343:367-1725(-)
MNEAPGAYRYIRGLCCALIAAVGLASDGLTVKLAQDEGFSPAAVLTLKAAFATAFLCFALTVTDAIGHAPGGTGGRLPSLRIRGRREISHLAVGAAAFAIGNICYTLGFQFTTVANLLALAALSPLWAALLSRPMLGEPIRLRTVLSTALAACGVVVVVVGVALTADIDRVFARDSALGSLLGLLAGMCLATYLVVVRHAQAVAPDTPVQVIPVVGFAVATLLGLALIPALHEPAGSPLVPSEGAEAGLKWLVLNGALCMALPFVLTTYAARLVPAPEVAIVMGVEFILGPMLAYSVIGEVPSAYTVAGGVCVFVAVVANAVFGVVDFRRAKPTPDNHTRVSSVRVSCDSEVGDNMVAGRVAPAAGPGLEAGCNFADDASHGRSQDASTTPAKRAASDGISHWWSALASRQNPTAPTAPMDSELELRDSDAESKGVGSSSLDLHHGHLRATE